MGENWSNTEVLPKKNSESVCKTLSSSGHLANVQNILKFQSTSKGLGHSDLDFVVRGLKKKSCTDSKQDYFQTKSNANPGN